MIAISYNLCIDALAYDTREIASRRLHGLELRVLATLRGTRSITPMWAQVPRLEVATAVKLGFCTHAAFRGHNNIHLQVMQETIITNSPPSPPADLRALMYSITVTQMPQLNGRGESVVGARLMRPGGTELSWDRDGYTRTIEYVLVCLVPFFEMDRVILIGHPLYQ
jgi:hypothetical protein